MHKKSQRIISVRTKRCGQRQWTWKRLKTFRFGNFIRLVKVSDARTARAIQNHWSNSIRKVTVDFGKKKKNGVETLNRYSVCLPLYFSCVDRRRPWRFYWSNAQVATICCRLLTLHTNRRSVFMDFRMVRRPYGWCSQKESIFRIQNCVKKRNREKQQQQKALLCSHFQ